MKKPKITEGEWKVENLLGYPRADRHPQIVSSGFSVCRALGGDVTEVESNIKAIAQVPNMIKALIRLKEAINIDYSDEYIFEDDINGNSHLGKVTITVNEARFIINTLKKAGCTE